MCCVAVPLHQARLTCWLQVYENAITARQAAANQDQSEGLPDGLKLVDASVLLQPGSKDGAVQVIRENGVGVAYSWSAARCEAQCPAAVGV